MRWPARRWRLPVPMPEAEQARRLATAPAIRQARRDTERFTALAEVAERARGIPDPDRPAWAPSAARRGRTQHGRAGRLHMPVPVFDSNRGAQVEALRRVDKAVADTRRGSPGRDRRRPAGPRGGCSPRTRRSESLQRDVLPGAQGAYDAAVKKIRPQHSSSFLDVLDAQRT